MTETRKMFFRGMDLQVRIGVLDHEKNGPQRVLIDLDISIVPPSKDHNDDINDVLDYNSLKEEIVALAQSRHFNLQETLASEIANLCLDFEDITAVRVTTQKPDAYEDCSSVGVVIERSL